MTARREFMCRPCKKGDCADCVRLLWDGEGCSHDCYDGRQLGLFDLAEAVGVVRDQVAPVREPDDVLDW